MAILALEKSDCFFSLVERLNPLALLRAELCNLRLKTPKKSVSRGPC